MLGPRKGCSVEGPESMVIIKQAHLAEQCDFVL